MTILSRLKRSGVNAEAGTRPYVTDDDFPTQMRKRTQKAVDDMSPQVQSELVRPYKAESYAAHEYYQVPPPGIEPWPTPVFPPIPLPSFRIPTPIFSVASGSYSSAQTIQIVCLTAGATIYYTLDNTEPTVHKTKYKIPLVLSANITLKARAFKDGMDASNIAVGIYLISALPRLVWPSTFTLTIGQDWSATPSDVPWVPTDVYNLQPYGNDEITENETSYGVVRYYSEDGTNSPVLGSNEIMVRVTVAKLLIGGVWTPLKNIIIDAAIDPGSGLAFYTVVTIQFFPANSVIYTIGDLWTTNEYNSISIGTADLTDPPPNNFNDGILSNLAAI